VVKSGCERFAKLLWKKFVYVVRIAGRVHGAIRRGDGKHTVLVQHTGKLIECKLRILDVLEDLEATHGIEGGILERQLPDVGFVKVNRVRQSAGYCVENVAGEINAYDFSGPSLREDETAVACATACVEDASPADDGARPPVPTQVLGFDKLTSHLVANESFRNSVDGVSEVSGQGPYTLAWVGGHLAACCDTSLNVHRAISPFRLAVSSVTATAGLITRGPSQVSQSDECETRNRRKDGLLQDDGI
jgi:hypothetical protein